MYRHIVAQERMTTNNWYKTDILDSTKPLQCICYKDSTQIIICDPVDVSVCTFSETFCLTGL